MLALKHMLIGGGLGMIAVAMSILGFDLYRELRFRRALHRGGVIAVSSPQWGWRTTVALGLLAWGPILIALSLVVVPLIKIGMRTS